MQNSLLLGVSVGESFAEFSLKPDNLDNTPLAQTRVYLSRESLKTSLAQFLSPYQDQTITKAFVSIRIPRKLLDYRLSGSVAHISTAGLEQWLEIAGNPAFPLTDQKLQFAIKERIKADGSIEKALNIEELTEIGQKIKDLNCSKVCLNFLHSSKFPEHRNLAEKHLSEMGLQVFVPEKTENEYEVSRWTKNALNATLSSVYSEIRSDLFAGLEAASLKTEDVYFVDGAGELFQNLESKEVSSLFAGTSVLGLVDENSDSDILYLGLEQFTLISPSVQETFWKSPWGPVEVSHIKTHKLGIQPTLGIGLNSFNRFDFSNTEYNWEPGPMFMGRGQQMTLLDLWSDNQKLNKISGIVERVSPQATQRFKTGMLTLSKLSTFRDNDFSHLTKELQSLTVQRIAMESRLRRQTKKMIVTGPLAPLFSNIFKKDPHTTIVVQEFCEADSLIDWGKKQIENKQN